MKYIFITGGVCSSLGKGVAAASIACLLENSGLKVTLQKIDPYLNIDPGTMSPYQHGEVYVTDDGAETDLDLGNYERFTKNAKFSKVNSVTTGQIYDTVIKRERKGGYLGKTVQIIPHITDEIKSRIKAASMDYDIQIVEIGGTVGDIESVPFLEAIRQFSRDVGRENVLYIHLTLIPYLGAAKESKTKPTQHSVKELMQIGISPDILMCRSADLMTDEMRDKLALFCNVEKEAVFSAIDIDTTIYEIPLLYERQGMSKIIERKLGLKPQTPNLSSWKKQIEKYTSAKKECTIAVAGKYITLQDAYKSIYEALMHGGIDNKCKVNVVKIDTEQVTNQNVSSIFKNVDGILVPGGFGERGFDGKITTAQYARENGIPYFGICLGLHVMAVEIARNVLGYTDANTTEIDPQSAYPVISLLEEQRKITKMGGTMRLGAYKAKLLSGTKIYQAYKSKEISERHRHRYEFSNDYKKDYEDNGVIFSAINIENDLIEAMELKDHPWFVAVQYHPEFKSKPTAPAPLFAAFIKASMQA